MPFALPYDFDTRADTRLLVKLGVGALGVMAVAGAWMLAVRQDAVGALGTLVVDALLIGFGRVVLQARHGAEGRITGEGVELRARRVWGVEMPGPVGTFPLQRFRAVQVERVLSSGNGTSVLRELERVTLAGKPGTPDVLVRVERVDGAGSPGEALAAALGLPVEVTRSPRRIALRGSR